MYYHNMLMYCCDTNSGTGGDAQLAKQEEILAALAALQLDVDAIEICADEIKASTVKPNLC